MLENAVVHSNHKGGVGKTSLTANVAATAAKSGWSVLVVDLDPQANLGIDLGYHKTDADDGGQSLLTAVAGNTAPAVLRVRENLNAIPAGPLTEELGAILQTRVNKDAKNINGVRDAIARHIEHQPRNYDLILIDTPPSTGPLVNAGLAAAHYLVIPTKGDLGSIHGLEGTAEKFGKIRADINPDLEVLGVVLFAFGAGDKRLLAEARQSLEEILDETDIPVFESFIRHTAKSATDTRKLGQVAHEYENAALDAEPFWKRLRKGKDQAAPIPSYSQASGGLAADYQNLTREILSAFASNSQERAA